MPGRGDYRYYADVSQKQRIVNLERKLKAAEDGSGITSLREKNARERAGFERKISSLRREITALEARKERELRECTQYWTGVTDDIEKYALKKIAEAEKHSERGWIEAAKTEKLLQEARAEIERLKREAAEKDAEKADLEGQLARRNRALNRNHTNSSIATSQEGVRKKKIHNSRTKSDLKPGAQASHEGHKRPAMEPTEASVFVAGPPEISENPDWVVVDVRRKLLAELRMEAKVIPYDFAVYRNRHTGKIFRVPIPPEMHNELNYGPGLKGAIVLMHSELNLPGLKVKELLSALSGGEIEVSQGFIAGLTREFAAKSGPEREAITEALLAGPYMHIDTTGARCNGGLHHVTVNANEKAVLLSWSQHKGREAAEKTPYAAGYAGCGVHDGEATFSNYVKDHQQCHAHLLRYLQDVAENEPAKTWAPGMQKLLRQVAHDHKSWADEGPTKAYKKKIRAGYTRLVNCGLKEYAQDPATKYYPDGENLLQRFIKERDAILYFLDHPEVPLTNNLAERMLRPVKRKQAAGVLWRSPKDLDAWCQTKSVLGTERLNGRSCFKKAVEVMSRPKPSSAAAE